MTTQYPDCERAKMPDSDNGIAGAIASFAAVVLVVLLGGCDRESSHQPEEGTGETSEHSGGSGATETGGTSSSEYGSFDGRLLFDNENDNWGESRVRALHLDGERLYFATEINGGEVYSIRTNTLDEPPARIADWTPQFSEALFASDRFAVSFLSDDAVHHQDRSTGELTQTPLGFSSDGGALAGDADSIWGVSSECAHWFSIAVESRALKTAEYDAPRAGGRTAMALSQTHLLCGNGERIYRLGRELDGSPEVAWEFESGRRVESLQWDGDALYALTTTSVPNGNRIERLELQTSSSQIVFEGENGGAHRLQAGAEPDEHFFMTSAGVWRVSTGAEEPEPAFDAHRIASYLVGEGSVYWGGYLGVVETSLRMD